MIYYTIHTYSITDNDSKMAIENEDSCNSNIFILSEDKWKTLLQLST